MGARSGFGLKLLQWFFRGVQFACAAIVLGIYSYFLATLSNHNLRIGNSIRAVEGISGAAVLFTAACLLFLCCFAGIKIVSLILMVLDVAFIAAFIYVAVVNKHGAGSCDGYVDTPFGSGQSGGTANGSDGFTALPSYHTACRLQTASLAVSIIAIIFFIFSILTEVGLARHRHKENRYGPSPQNNNTSGYGAAGAVGTGAKAGLFSRVFRRNTARSEGNALPAHTHPDQVNDGRQSYATDNTAINPENPYNKHESGYGYPANANTTTTNGAYAPDAGHMGHHHVPQQTGYGQGPPSDYRYDDGVYNRV